MNDFIGVYDDLFTKEYCDSLINFFEEVDSKFGVKNRKDEDEKVRKMLKDDNFLFLHDYNDSVQLRNHFNTVLWKDAYRKYADEYGILDELPYHISQEEKLQRTKPGHGYHAWHCEASNKITSNRIISWILYLNDVEEGGETEFLYQHKRVKAKAGRIVFFPAAYTHTHRGNPPLSNVKYILTGWVVFE